MLRGQARQDSAAAPAQVNTTAAPRSVTTYRVGKLTMATGPILCLVRGLSNHKAVIDVDLPFAEGSRAVLEIGRERLSGTLSRLGDRRAQLHSDRIIEVEAILADPSFVATAGQRALPRIDVSARARIDLGAHRIAAEVRDISTDGVKVFTEELLCVGDEVRIVLRGIERPLPGVVRWTDGDHAGIEFVQRLPIGGLNAWLASQSDGEVPWAPPVISKS